MMKTTSWKLELKAVHHVMALFEGGLSTAVDLFLSLFFFDDDDENLFFFNRTPGSDKCHV